jgi:porin
MNLRLIGTLIGVWILCSRLVYSQSNFSFGEMPTIHWDRYQNYISTDILYTHDYISNTGGEKAGPRNIGALDFFIDSDFSKFSSIKGEFRVHYIHINQNDNRGSIGDAQTASNIDMPSQVDRLGDLWYLHHWSDEFKMLVGIHDISSEFNITESSLNFLNSSFGTGAEFASSGQNGPSIFPLSTVGARILYNINDELSLRSGLYDANTGNPGTYRSFHSDVGSNQGLMHISELAHQQDETKVAVGIWNYSKPQLMASGEDTASSLGAYGIVEQKFGNSLWAFIRYGWANPLANMIQSNTCAGVVYRGLFQTKKTLDEVGLGATQAHFSRSFLKELGKEEDSSISSQEIAYEAYYQFRPIKELIFRPDLQYISHPSGLHNLKDAWALGLRTVVEI